MLPIRHQFQYTLLNKIAFWQIKIFTKFCILYAKSVNAKLKNYLKNICKEKLFIVKIVH